MNEKTFYVHEGDPITADTVTVSASGFTVSDNVARYESTAGDITPVKVSGGEVCPVCGTCPHCGHKARHYEPIYPYYPQPWSAPNFPSPQIWYTVC